MRIKELRHIEEVKQKNRFAAPESFELENAPVGVESLSEETTKIIGEPAKLKSKPAPTAVVSAESIEESILPLSLKMVEVIKKIGKEKRFTMILEKKVGLYFDESVDLTTLATLTYDKTK